MAHEIPPKDKYFSITAQRAKYHVKTAPKILETLNSFFQKENNEWQLSRCTWKHPRKFLQDPVLFRPA